MAHTDTDDIQATLGLTAETRHRARRSRWLWIAIVVLVVAGGLWAWWHTRGDAGPQYQTSPVARRTLTVSVTATGALDALTQVDIGTEISGIIESVDVDFNSPVHVGQILARVNTEKLDAQAAQARASLNASKAKQVQAQATLVEAQADLARFQHVRELSGGKVPSQQDMDAQVATVKRDEADQHSADAGVAQSQANLDAIETDIHKAIIRSPINGIVLNREVDPGQTVAASFQTPTLFTLAEDLTKMRLIVDVDEADIGQVRAGERATFRVDAYPDRTFDSTVQEVRSTPTTSNGVVTYQTVLTVDNKELLLRPGMTATADITVTEVKDALVVPNAALRFTPPETMPQQTGFFRPPPGNEPRDRSADASTPHVWTLVNGKPTLVKLTPGPSDGRFTVVEAGSLQVGTPVITDLAVTAG
ncbi:MAG TPA: efflux RND transporter periplasmic adaptor subunit [Vicinamibacterales bacterium]|jgi:HlyD family secretion protein|nr:efflux RND transporter periplasmic adaptor subunit [Vicinamibacterales bacterium]